MTAPARSSLPPPLPRVWRRDTPSARNIEVWLDNYPMPYALAASEQKGKVLVPRLDADGEPADPNWEEAWWEGEPIPTQVLRGRVELVRVLQEDFE